METKLVKVKINPGYRWEDALEDLIEEKESGDEPTMKVLIEDDDTFKLSASYETVGCELLGKFKDKETCENMANSFNFSCEAKVVDIQRSGKSASVVLEIPIFAED